MASSSQGAEASESPHDRRCLGGKSCVEKLVHADQCCDASCTLLSCQKMKRLIRHSKGCKRKTKGRCFPYKQLIALCSCHAKGCQEKNCPVPFCHKVRHKQHRQQLLHRLQQMMMSLRNVMTKLDTLSSQKQQEVPPQEQPPPQGPQAAMPKQRPLMRLPPPRMPGDVLPLPRQKCPAIAVVIVEDLMSLLQEFFCILSSIPELTEVISPTIRFVQEKQQELQMMHQDMVTLLHQEQHSKRG